MKKRIHTVGELIAILSEHPPDAEVYILGGDIDEVQVSVRDDGRTQITLWHWETEAMSREDLAAFEDEH